MPKTEAEIVEFLIANPSVTWREAKKALQCGSDRLSAIMKTVDRADVKDADIILENIRLAKLSQKQKDLNRIKDKSFRETSRIDNSLFEVSNEIKSILSKYDFSRITKKHESKRQKAVGLLQMADWHANELVKMAGNEYDFNVLSRRLKKYADDARLYFKATGVKNILIANTGDNMNSDRRLDEYLSQATNRTNAMMLFTYLMEQFLVDLNKDFNIKYAHVTGNESRVKDEHGYTDIVASDNYDSAIFNILRFSMRTAKGIDFIVGDPQEMIVDVAGQNVLLIHGDQIRSDVSKSIAQIKGKYADLGIVIDFVIFGDIHEARIGDTYARSSSAVGSNKYSFSGLQLTGRASQNIHIFYENRNRDSIKIDLQNTDGIVGYDVIKELESYNAKSAGRLHEGATIYKIVI